MKLSQNFNRTIGYFSILLVFFFAPINELLIAYFLPQLPFFDFYPIALSLILIALFIFRKGSITINSNHILLFFFFLTVFLVVSFSDNIVDLDGRTTLEVNTFFLRKSIGYLILGFACSKLKLPSKAANYPFPIITFIFLSLVDWNLLKLNTLNYPNQSQWGNYHYLSECYAIMSFLFISNIISKGRTFITIVYLISIIVLFLLGSRSSLFIYMLASILLLYIGGCFSSIFAILCVFGFVLILSTEVMNNIFTFIFENYRMFSIFISNNEGSSVARAILAKTGMKDIYENIFTGSLGGQIKYGGTLWGGYIHDFRSYWRQFGIIAFLLYCLILIRVNLLNMVFLFAKKDPTNLFITSSLLFFTIESIFSRSYLSTYIYFFIGFSVSYNSLKVHHDS